MQPFTLIIITQRPLHYCVHCSSVSFNIFFSFILMMLVHSSMISLQYLLALPYCHKPFTNSSTVAAVSSQSHDCHPLRVYQLCSFGGCEFSCQYQCNYLLWKIAVPGCTETSAFSWIICIAGPTARDSSVRASWLVLETRLSILPALRFGSIIAIPSQAGTQRLNS